MSGGNRYCWRFADILQKPPLKLKSAAVNVILLNRFTSSENISEYIKIKTENLFQLKLNV